MLKSFLLFFLSAPLLLAFDLGSLPVLHENRVKPLAVAAEEIVLGIHGRSTYRDAAGQKYDALSVVVEAMQRPDVWAETPMIAIDYTPLQHELGLTSNRVSLKELAVPSIQQRLRHTLQIERERQMTGRMSTTWTRTDDNVLSLLRRIAACEALLHGEALALMPVIGNDEQALWASQLTLPTHSERRWHQELASAMETWPLAERRGQTLAQHLTEQNIWLTLGDLAFTQDPLLATHPGTNVVRSAALQFGAQLRAAASTAETKTAAAATLSTALHTYGTSEDFAYPSANKMKRERLYHTLQPFTWTWVCYLLGGLVTAIGMMKIPGGKNYRLGWILAGTSLTLAGVVWNIIGFAFRLDISNWGAVTNLYETVVYVALVVALLGLYFALRYEKALYAVAAGIGAGLCSFVGAIMPPDLGAHIGPLQPVLRSRFWLWVHVKIIVASYGAFLLAWVIANIVLAQSAWKKQAVSQAAGIIIYRCLQVGLLLCIAGTLLGAVWADQAWGRFWGWDPKEVWALVVILIYLIPLHLRLIGSVRATGLAAWSVFGFGSVIFSWYGVNFILGAGLHSYGFGTGGQGIVLSCVAVQVLITSIQLRRIPRTASQTQNDRQAQPSLVNAPAS